MDGTSKPLERAARVRWASSSPPAAGFALCPWRSAETSRFVPERPLARDEHEARALVRLALPFVVHGLQAGTEAERRWSFADLRARWGEHEVPVVPLRDGMLSYETSNGIAYVRQRLADVIDRFTHDVAPRWYVSVHPAPHLPGLAEEARTPIYAVDASWRASRVWIGSGGTLTPIHHELTDNVLCVISGEKEVVLFPPSERARLDPSPPWSGTPHISRIDPRSMQVSAATTLASPWRCTLRAGDSLFIPRLWWHAVRTTGESIAINYWWAKGLAAVVPRAAELYKEVFRLST